MASVFPYPRPIQPTGFKAGSLDVGTTAVQGPDVKVARGHTVVLQADPSNTADIWVGDSSVAVGTGAKIEPGGGLMLAIDNLSKLYFISSASGQKLYWSCEVE